MNEFFIFQFLMISFGFSSIGVFIVLFFITAGYGQYVDKKWGPTINNKLGWFLMEVPTVIIYFIYFIIGDRTTDLIPLIFFGIWIGISIAANNGNLGDIFIGSLIVGGIYGLLESLNYLYFYYVLYKRTDREDPFDFGEYRDMLLAYWLFLILLIITTALIFGGILTELRKEHYQNNSLYPIK